MITATAQTTSIFYLWPAFVGFGLFLMLLVFWMAVEGDSMYAAASPLVLIAYGAFIYLMAGLATDGTYQTVTPANESKAITAAVTEKYAVNVVDADADGDNAYELNVTRENGNVAVSCVAHISDPDSNNGTGKITFTLTCNTDLPTRTAS